MFETIVLALDGSESSDLAYDYAADLARKTGGKIVAVHVKEMVAGRGAGPIHLDEDELQEKIRGQVKALAEAGIQATLELSSAMVGGPAHVIADTASRESADVIVTGTRGHTGIAGVILGSVAQRLLHLAACPVLVVPPNSARPAGTSGRAKATASA
jgi:nucleotide-binding universal stress UspA family protein